MNKDNEGEYRTNEKQKLFNVAYYSHDLCGRLRAGGTRGGLYWYANVPGGK